MAFQKYILAAISLALLLPCGTVLAQTTKDAQKEIPPTVEIPPPDEPMLNDSEIAGWAVRVVPEIHSFSYENHRAVLNGVRGYFTEKGFLAFYRNLQRTKMLETLKAQGLSISVSSTGTPRICRQNADGGTYGWTVEIPKLFLFKDADDKERNAINQYVILKIVRSNDPVNRDGVAIENWSNIPADTYKGACDYARTSEIGAMLDGLPPDTKTAVEKLFQLEDENKALKKQLDALKK